MAGAAVLEREYVTENTRTQTRERDFSAEAKRHSDRIPENYNYLRYSDNAAWMSSARGEEVFGRFETRDSGNTATIERPFRMPAGKKTLFDNVNYVNGQLVYTDETQEAPVQDAVIAPAEPEDYSDEDAMPTRQTMQSLNRSMQAAERTQKVSAISSLSAKTKVTLAVVASAVVIAFAVVCVNTGVINSLQAKNAELQTQVQEQAANYELLQEEAESFSDPYNEMVREWAERNGMSR